MLSGQYWAGGDSIIMCKQITELTKCGAASLLYTTSPPLPPTCVLLLTNPILSREYTAGRAVIATPAAGVICRYDTRRWMMNYGSN